MTTENHFDDAGDVDETNRVRPGSTAYVDDGDGFWEVAPEEGPRRGLVFAGWVTLALVLVALYIVAAGFFGQRVPNNTEVSGVSIGGMTENEAIDALRAELDGPSRERITISSPARKVVVDPVEAGLGLDYEESIEGLTGFSLNPIDVANHIKGGVRRDVVRTIDRQRLTKSVDAALRPVRSAPSEGSVSLSGGEVKAVRSKTGLDADTAATVKRITDTWPAEHAVVAVTSTLQPKLSNSEIDRFTSEFAKPAMSGPVTVRTDKGKEFDVSAAALAEAITVRNDGNGKLSEEFDDAKVEAAVVDAAQEAGVTKDAVEATVTHTGGDNFKVTPSKVGVGLVESSIFEPVKKALLAKDRTAEVRTRKLWPQLTTEEARKSIPKAEISRFATTLPPNPGRTTNVTIAARALDGTFVPPGGQLSLNAVLGKRTPEKGYTKQPVIYAGRMRMDYGGGVSQLSTTLFNAAFYAGVRIDEYTAHSFYIPRYPEGREATLSWPEVDQKWTNTTDGGILIRSEVRGDQVIVRFRGVKTFEVTDSKSPRRNIKTPKRITDSGKDCVAQAPAEGFDVTVTRTLRKDGKVVSTDNFVTHYIAEDAVTCT